jgi:hypothetical protein
LAEEVLSGSLRKNKTIHVLITEDEDPKLYFSQDDVNDKVPITTTEDKDKEKDS